MLSLDLDEMLMHRRTFEMALENLKQLRGCEVHLTHIPTPGDEAGLRKLKVNLTCDAEYSSKSLFLGGD